MATPPTTKQTDNAEKIAQTSYTGSIFDDEFDGQQARTSLHR